MGRLTSGAAIVVGLALCAGAFFFFRAPDSTSAESPREARAKRATKSRAPLARLAAESTADLKDSKLTGRVTAAEGGAPIAGAEICARDAEGAICAHSGADGRYLITAIASGRWSLFAGKAGYLTARREPGVREDIELYPGATESADFVLSAGGVKLTGLVKDSGGGVVPGATLEEEHGARGTSDDRGRFALWLSPGDAVLTVRAEGYAPEIVTGGAPGELEVVLHPESTISGRVVNAKNGAPIAGARVMTDWVGGELETDSDENGAFFLPGVPPGEHRLRAVGEGWLAELSEPLVIGRADAVRDVRLEATPALSFTGAIVQLPDRTGCDQGFIEVWSDQNELDRSKNTDARGRFAIHGLMPGHYEVNAYCEPNGPPAPAEVVLADADVHLEIEAEAFAARVHGVVLGHDGQPRGNLDLDLQEKSSGALAFAAVAADGRFTVLLPELGTWMVSVGGGCANEDGPSIEVLVAEPPPVIVSLAGLGTIRGRAIDRDQQPVRTSLLFSSSIAPDDDGCSASQIVNTGADGRFEVAFAPKLWSVRAADNAGAPAELRDAKGPLEAIDVRPGEISDVELVFPSSRGSIRGRVVDHRGQPVPDAMVSVARIAEGEDLLDETAAVTWDELDFDAGFEVTDDDGRFVATDLPEGLYGAGAKAREGGAGKAGPVRLGGEVTITLEPWASIDGFASKGGAERAQNYAIYASNGEDHRVLNVRAEDGHFSIKSLSPGAWVLHAEAKDGEVDRSVELRAGEAMKNVELALSAKARVRGRVVLDDGQPVRGAEVVLGRAPGENEHMPTADPPSVATDEHGRFEMINAPLGKVWLTIEDADHFAQLTELELHSGETQEVEVQAVAFQSGEGAADEEELTED